MASFIPGRGVTEYGEMFHGVFDAWGRSSINSILFDGTKVTAILVEPVDNGLGIDLVNICHEVTEVPLFRRLTVFGDICLDGVDEWGHRRVDSMLEDGMLALPFIRNMGVEAVGIAWEIVDAGISAEAVDMARECGDHGAGMDAVNMAKECADLGAGVELVNMCREATDMGAGFDAVNMIHKIIDSSAGVDAVNMAHETTDSGVGLDAVNMAHETTDSGMGLDAVNMAHEARDAGMGLDAVNMAREIVDAGAGFDAIYVVASVAVDESAIGIEYAIISPVALDSGAGAEAVTMRKEVLDFGAGVEFADWFLSIYGMVLIDNDDVGYHSIPYKDWRQRNIPVQVHRRSVGDKVYIDSDEVGDVVVEWEDRVSGVVPGERTLIVTGVVELYD